MCVVRQHDDSILVSSEFCNETYFDALRLQRRDEGVSCRVRRHSRQVQLTQKGRPDARAKIVVEQHAAATFSGLRPSAALAD